MKKELIKLGFKEVENDSIIAYHKSYKTYTLWLAATPSDIYYASIYFGKTEIAIPFEITKEWLCDFDKQNKM